MTKFNCCFGAFMVYYDYPYIYVALNWDIRVRHKNKE